MRSAGGSDYLLMLFFSRARTPEPPRTLRGPPRRRPPAAPALAHAHARPSFGTGTERAEGSGGRCGEDATAHARPVVGVTEGRGRGRRGAGRGRETGAAFRVGLVARESRTGAERRRTPVISREEPVRVPRPRRGRTGVSARTEGTGAGAGAGDGRADVAVVGVVAGGAAATALRARGARLLHPLRLPAALPVLLRLHLLHARHLHRLRRRDGRSYLFPDSSFSPHLPRQRLYSRERLRHRVLGAGHHLPTNGSNAHILCSEEEPARAAAVDRAQLLLRAVRVRGRDPGARLRRQGRRAVRQDARRPRRLRAAGHHRRV